MKIKARLAFLAGGAIVAGYGLILWHSGVVVHQSAWLRGTHYSAGTVAAGVFMSCWRFCRRPLGWIVGRPERKTRNITTMRRITKGITDQNSYSSERTLICPGA
jgi:hypothetical protein